MADDTLEQLPDGELDRQIRTACERVKSAGDIYAAVPAGPLSDKVLEEVIDPRTADLYRLLDERTRRAGA